MPKEKKSNSAKKSENKEEKAEKPKKLAQAQFEEKVIEIAKMGLTSEKIGEKLRQQEIHPREHNKKISKILKENKIYINPELKNVEEKLQRMEKHTKKNKGDKRAIREQTRILSKIRKIKEYNELI